VDIIYLIIPFVFYSLQFTILTKYSRNEGSFQVAFYRQLWIFLMWLPVLYFFPLDLKVFWDNLFFIILTSTIGAIYLFVNFKSMDYVPIWVWNVFQLASRILLTVLVWVLFLSDNVNTYQFIWILLLIASTFLLLKKWKFNSFWILLSLLSWWLIVANWYYFLQYSDSFNPILAWYILEVVNGIILFFIILFSGFSKRKSIQKSINDWFKVKKKSFYIIILTWLFPLIATWSLAISYEIFSFTVVWVFLTLMVPTVMIMWYFFLKEKLSLKSVIAILIITILVIFIKLVENLYN